MPAPHVTAADLDRLERALLGDALSGRWHHPSEPWLPLREPFGAWLAAQRDRGDGVDELARIARSDGGWPTRGGPQEVGARLARLAVGGDCFRALGEAERCWSSL